ncbi:tubulin monoglycylase TTLL3 isoform X2 [Gouania willdenowi]|uniref:tubulin monoglycylase TTLL3 isoform X2 n=1 Tax=Gouania willdenowi TaxID=441366 RepID=UPI001056D357|nr:tubulin monoglycylase TTLL3-like isoform X2 [Gouania willdenowi]
MCTVGICVNLRNLHWFDAADPDAFFPRCYRLGAEDEKHAFIEDFRRTACTSVLRHVIETHLRRHAEIDIQNTVGSVSEGRVENLQHPCVGSEIISTALRVCQDFLCGLKHGDLDVTAEKQPLLEEQQWVDFLQKYYMVVHKGAVIRGSSEFLADCEAMLARLQEVCPQLDTDGVCNIWIVKPGAKSRGRGIMCMNRLEKILSLVDTDRAVVKDSKWVVQKYLEQPLLVHGTKFDLRQWFLVTDWNPLTVWFYDECYLRFSTQPFSTKTLDSSVHLCNNSIQKHLHASRDRHPALPEDNMWSSSQFRTYLQQQQQREAEWELVVVPGMQQAVVHTLQTAQDYIEPRKASFELYGADFMLGNDLTPWLLEINASPTMACSTAVTSRLCPRVQVDTLKVVLDHSSNPSADTGGFRLIYKQAAVEVPYYVGVKLLVEGSPIRQTRPLLHRRTCSSPQELENRHNSQRQNSNRITKILPSDKENQEKSKLRKSAPSKKEFEMRADVHPNLQPYRSLTCQQLSVAHTEPGRKAQQIGLSAKATTLVPRSVSFSFQHPQSMSKGKVQSSADQKKPFSQSSFPKMSVPQQTTSTRAIPSFKDGLPCLDVLQLQPKVVKTTQICHSFNHGARKQIPLLCLERDKKIIQ